MNSLPKWSSTNALISRVRLFAGLNPEELAEICVGARKINAARDELLFRKDDACTGLLVIIHGQVKLFFSSPQGNEKILGVFGQMQTLGESALFQGNNHQIFAQTLNECMLLHICKAKILDALNSNRSFARRVIEHLSQSVSALIQDVESYSLHSGRQRVINYLAREALRANPALPDLAKSSPRSGLAKEKQTLLIIHLTTSKGVIASRLNLTQEHFSRILHDLSTCGLLSVAGRDIHIEKPARFWQCASQIVTEAEDEQQKDLALIEPSEQPARGSLVRLTSEKNAQRPSSRHDVACR